MNDPQADVTTEELAARLGEPGLVVVDVRSELEYRGIFGSPCDPRQGHIPGALHLALDDLLTLEAAALEAALGAPAGVEVIAYCHSGARSAQAVVMLRSLGFQARNYRGSWHAWSQDPALPMSS